MFLPALEYFSPVFKKIPLNMYDDSAENVDYIFGVNVSLTILQIRRFIKCIIPRYRCSTLGCNGGLYPAENPAETGNPRIAKVKFNPAAKVHFRYAIRMLIAGENVKSRVSSTCRPLIVQYLLSGFSRQHSDLLQHAELDVLGSSTSFYAIVYRRLWLALHVIPEYVYRLFPLNSGHDMLRLLPVQKERRSVRLIKVYIYCLYIFLIIRLKKIQDDFYAFLDGNPTLYSTTIAVSVISLA